MEIRATKKCAYGRMVNFDLSLGIVGNQYVTLNGFYFDANGYIVVCNPGQKNLITERNKCTVDFNFKKPKRKRAMAITLRTVDEPWDRFGYFKGNCDKKDRKNVCLDDDRSRAVRVVSDPNTNFITGEWRFMDLASMTPGGADNLPPTSSPSFAPSVAGKGGKGELTTRG